MMHVNILSKWKDAVYFLKSAERFLKSPKKSKGEFPAKPINATAAKYLVCTYVSLRGNWASELANVPREWTPRYSLIEDCPENVLKNNYPGNFLLMTGLVQISRGGGGGRSGGWKVKVLLVKRGTSVVSGMCTLGLLWWALVLLHPLRSTRPQF